MNYTDLIIFFNTIISWKSHLSWLAFSEFSTFFYAKISAHCPTAYNYFLNVTSVLLFSPQSIELLQKLKLKINKTKRFPEPLVTSSDGLLLSVQQFETQRSNSQDIKTEKQKREHMQIVLWKGRTAHWPARLLYARPKNRSTVIFLFFHIQTWYHLHYT